MLSFMSFKSDTFMYFSYGANILSFTMHMHSPSAEFVASARLDHYRLDFIKYSSFWGGPTATLVPTAGAHVWGVMWKLPYDDMEKLDAIKGVAVNKYYVKYLRVLTSHLGYYTARVYIQRVNPLPRGDNDPIPIEYWPSWTYKEIMIMGATEHQFPEYYIKQLKKIKDNGEEGALRTVCLLTRYAKDEPCDCKVPGRIPRIPLKLDLKLIRSGRKILEQKDRIIYETTHDTFLYYAYGSNLLKKRIHINNPSAEFLGIGKLDDHQLDFHLQSERWHGAVATIVPRSSAHVWGAIWRLHNNDLAALEKQEGVDTNRYFAKTVDVITPDDHKIQCRVYQQTSDPPTLNPGEVLPMNRRPSITYLECIIKGANECRLPPYYIKSLEKIPHNGQEASPEMIEMIK